MRTKLALGALLVVGLLGCSGAYESAEMKVRWQPPRGAKLIEEQAGPPRVARFSSGIEIREVLAEPPAIVEDKLEALLQEVAGKAGAATTGNVISSRIGDVPAGKVARWTIKDGDTRRLIYYVPSGKRFLLLSLTASEGRYGEAENQLELSLGSLRVRE